MNSFKETGLNPELLDALDHLGFITPTPIQQKVIPQLLDSDKDIIAFAQTGTGKTAAFGLPILQHIDTNSGKIQVIILCPTRELCLQICSDIKNYGKNIRGLKVTPVYGGASIETQIKSLKRGCQIVVGTPGRTLDLINKRKLFLNDIKRVILDEADEMLSMGFQEDLTLILAHTPEHKQTLLFSATMPKEILSLAKKTMNNPVEISAGDMKISTVNVSHAYYVAHAKDRYVALKRIVDANPDIYGIVFCRTRSETKEVARKLSHDGYNAEALHGDLSQKQRDEVMDKFRKKKVQLLIATDVAARGLDINNLSHIINYNLPEDPDIYIHRSGRTGRAEKTGESLSIIHMKEYGRIHEIERKTGKKFERRNIPLGREICEKQLMKLVDNVRKTIVNEKEIASFLPIIYEKLEIYSREELIKHIVSVEFNRFLSFYENAADINVTGEKHSYRDHDNGNVFNRKSNHRGRSNSSFARFFINVGSKDNLTPKDLIGLINRYVPDRNVKVGEIEIMKTFSFFEVDEDFKQVIPRLFKKAKFNGSNLIVEHSTPKRSSFSGKNRFTKKKRTKEYRR